MSKLKYSEDGRLLFTKEMKKEYTILIPMMLPIHLQFMKNILRKHGYKAELLDTTHPRIIEEGLQYVHNDTCYPALLVIGQLLDAVKRGKYDINKTALIITQTGGGCRASNYIYLLRKALKQNSLEHVPVISFNLNGMEKNPGFKLTLNMLIEFVYAVLYGDILMHLSNQVRPYEINPGDTDRLTDNWIKKISRELKGRSLLNKNRFKKNMWQIASEFADIPVRREEKVKVGIVGEIYMKYSPLGNNNLEAFLQQEDVEIEIPGLMDFVIYTCDNTATDTKLYGMKKGVSIITRIVKNYLANMKNILIEAVKSQPCFRAPSSYDHVKSLVKGYIGTGAKMGEGWLLTAEMLDLITSGVENIICTQPFGCLPNHISGKGMIRKIKENHPNANIVAIDYDPGATRINQENRIKLMLSVARMNLLNRTANSKVL
ncbi:MAG: 2-hydroxyglutaryl-CoA dehydratase [Clostridiales bacterium]|jgi:predicted nucleotide-binding protein (sugar kinase/HSP70/actin superfamily)|nr:2-hydroxyglutaryl-CoA dehydratase [Clostridiales bacterium]